MKLQTQWNSCSTCYRETLPKEVCIEVLERLILPEENSVEFSYRTGRDGDWWRRVNRDNHYIKGIEYVIMDEILCKLNVAHLWREEPLLSWYWRDNIPPDMSKPIQCSNPRCEEWFGLEEKDLHQIYCSDSCRSMAGQIKRGLRKPSRVNFSLIPCAVCGEDIIRWTTRQGGRNTKYCSLQCKNIARRTSYKREMAAA